MDTRQQEIQQEPVCDDNIFQHIVSIGKIALPVNEKTDHGKLTLVKHYILLSLVVIFTMFAEKLGIDSQLANFILNDALCCS